MALSSASSTYIGSLISAGADAMSNLYYVRFSGKLINDVSDSMMVRLSGIGLPTFTMGEHEVNYITQKIHIPSAEITGEKELSLTFRLDNNYKLYEYLLKQQSMTLSGNLGWATNMVPNSVDDDCGLTVRVYAFDRSKGDNPDAEENYSEMLVCKYCWIEDVQGLQFTYDNANAMEVNVKIGFMDYEDPMNLFEIY